jgi:hypothetical protein
MEGQHLLQEILDSLLMLEVKAEDMLLRFAMEHCG